jgi:type IV pilus assembly protein PilB
LASKKEIQKKDQKIGKILVKEGLITDFQLREALRIQKGLKSYKPVGQILIDRKIITQKQLNFMLDSHKKRPRLGEILVRAGVITEEQLKKALDQQKETGLRLGEVLIKLKFISEEVMRQALCIQQNIPFINLDNITVDRSLVKIINKKYAQRYQIFPISKVGYTITVAMDDPTDTELVKELEAFSGHNIKVVTAKRSAIHNAFLRLYEDELPKKSDSNLRLDEEEGYESHDKLTHVETMQQRKADTLVTQIIRMGMDHAVTDIHIESMDRQLSLRFRKDGVLREPELGTLQEELNRHRREIISRIKILGKLDIAEKRRPQDGSFRARMVRDGLNINIDFRISIVPGYYGENAVIRILDARNAPKSIYQLGYTAKTTETFRQLLERNTGIILITGPTGSGKTTTLCGALMTLYQPGIKILTAEDPIEYVYDNITQCEVNTKLDNTFANYVRAFLRQDPEVIMIGEIRDSETAEMAFRAAQTGHIVLSTLHTNDAISSITRLLGLGVDPNLLTSCLLGVVSQRLVRQICPKCKEEYKPSEDILKEFFNEPPTDIRWFRGQKCSDCGHTGYSGRLAVAEMWIPSQEDVILINKGAGIDELRESANKNTSFMAQDAIELLRSGKTNLEELIRTLPYSNIYQFRNFI